MLILFVLMLAPVFVDPLFNDYKPLREGAVRQAILSLARANQIPTDNVVEFDASRQTTRISANVAGFLGTTRVALNDNLLNKSSLPEIKAVMGHEMGHYVLNHGLRLTVYLALVIAFALWFVHRTMDWALARWGTRFGAGRSHRSGGACRSRLRSSRCSSSLATPLTNSIVRQAEAEADAFGLNAAQEPHGFAMAAMRLSTYRKLTAGCARGNRVLRSSERLRSRARRDDLAQGASAECTGERARSRREAGAACGRTGRAASDTKPGQ